MKINIIGAGLAGLSAALTLAENGIKSNLISVQQSERAQSVMAEGGINACLNTMGENDKIELFRLSKTKTASFSAISADKKRSAPLTLRAAREKC